MPKVKNGRVLMTSDNPTPPAPKAHVGIRVDEEMMAFLKRAGVDLMEAFPGVEFTQSDVIRLMLCGAEREIRQSPAWLRRQVRGKDS